MAELETLMDEYYEAVGMDARRSSDLISRIIEQLSVPVLLPIAGLRLRMLMMKNCSSLITFFAI